MYRDDWGGWPNLFSREMMRVHKMSEKEFWGEIEAKKVECQATTENLTTETSRDCDVYILIDHLLSNIYW